MNKYQEALIYFCNGCHHEQEEGDYGTCKRVEGRCKHYRSLKELVDKEKSPTLEEVKKEWEKLGYELIRHERNELIFNFKEDGTIFTMWNFNEMRYSKYWRGTPANITLQEHQLLTKTFKALGWL